MWILALEAIPFKTILFRLKAMQAITQIKLNKNQMWSLLLVGLAGVASMAHAGTISSLGADGWASVGNNNLGAKGTLGGFGASSAKTYTVSNRNQLIQALHGGTATIRADGSFSGTLDNSKKIIYIAGSISLNMNKALTELTASNYLAAASAANATCASNAYPNEAAMWRAYYAAYKPPYAKQPSGKPENARACGANQQKSVVVLNVPSNTSIIGVGANAKIVHGMLLMSGSSRAPVDNIVVRNVAFEDAFDFFPQWDPTDSGGRWNSAYDNVAIQHASHVWIDHCSFSDGARTDKHYPSVWAAPYNGESYHVQHHDGLTDITKTANYVTLSYNHYFNHDKSILIGGTDTPSLSAENPNVLKTTLHHNYFQNLVQRKARVRYGMVHFYNNYFVGSKVAGADYGWLVGWTAGQGAKIFAENNVFQINGGNVNAGDVVSSSISASNVSKCAALSGMSNALCSAYIFDQGTLLNNKNVSASSQAHADSALVNVSTTPWPAANAPTGAPAATPARFYNYSVGSNSNLPASVMAGAGVGKL
jgi:pectate lyase